MSTKTYSNIGASIGTGIGTYFGGPLGGAIGRYAGNFIGYGVGSNVNGPKVLKGYVGPHLADLAVQSSSYGEMVPVLYGCARISGNIIWALPIREAVTIDHSNSGGGKGGGGQQKTTRADTTFSYFSTLAIAICEGPVDELVRVWADAKVINQADYNFRFYKGTATQMPDSLIESFEAVGKTPAYRDLAYVVIEDFPLADYGNRIPNFTFEIRKTVNIESTTEQPVEDLIKSIVLIPGAGEFVYDDMVQSKVPGELVDGAWVQRSNISRINQNNREGKADGLVALDQLKATCKNIEWVAPVVCWFADNINAGTCTIKPGVEFQNGATTTPDIWAVANFNRSTAKQISLKGISPQYGGTPSDASLLRYLRELKLRGYNIMFNPMFFMDTEHKPWRGRVTGNAREVASFFTKEHGYNAMITHYANLVKNLADAFIIGSELVGLTSVQAADNSFPAVNELVALAARVKEILGPHVKITYAADWSEYHHEKNGWYNLDPLWASPNIDIVGIDAYFPLTDRPEPITGFTQQEIIDGWTNGEGYDWFYKDTARTIKENLTPQYAWKDIGWWWNNRHINPDNSVSAWVPASKKIWFTEYGFPSVDGATNQPNVFYDQNSSESNFPHYSQGRVDFRAQRNALSATEKKWTNSNMVERKFVWTWDARPFPFWPDLTNIWSDGNLWKYGHWVQGKLGASSLAAIVADLSKRGGLSDEKIDVSSLTDIVDGYILKGQGSVRSALDKLRSAYFFDAVESGGKIKYIKRGGANFLPINQSDFIAGMEDKKSVTITRTQEFELPQKIDVIYLNKSADYQSGNQHSQRLSVNSKNTATLGLPIVMGNQLAKNIADISLYNSWVSRSQYQFILPLKYAYLEPTDVINVNIDSTKHTLRIEETLLTAPGLIKIKAVAEDASVYNFYNEPGLISPQTNVVSDVGDSVLVMLDLPAMPSDANGQGLIRYAVCGKEPAWKGAAIFRSDDAGNNFNQVVTIAGSAVIGIAIEKLAPGVTDIFDYENYVTINLYGSATLESLSELAVLNGANIAKIGDEIIQFKNAKLIAEGKYILSGLLRGRLGTENAIPTHKPGDVFVLIDNNLTKEPQSNALIGLSRLYKAVSVGQNITDVTAETFTYHANSLTPLAPVHITSMRDEDGNVTIYWIRRTRIDGGWRDNVDVPLGEVFEKYEVDIINGNNIVRTIGVNLPSVIYDIAAQIIDFGSVQENVALQVYQISEVVGRGKAGFAVV